MPKNLKHNNRSHTDQPHNLFCVSPDKVKGKELLFDGEIFHHIKNVLRKKRGEIIFATDGRGYRFCANIARITRSVITAHIVKREFVKKKDPIDIGLAFVPLKGKRNDLIIGKGTELGITTFLPFISKLSVVTMLYQTKLRRLEKIAGSAMLQSQQYYMPKIIFKKNIPDLIDLFNTFDLVVFCDKKGSSAVPLGARSILCIVGPEGGFDNSETTLFKNNGAVSFSLGPFRLRSETAALVGIIKIRTIYNIM